LDERYNVYCNHEGWLYLAVVIDLRSRLAVGWSMQARMKTRLALNPLTMAVWYRKLKNGFIIHSDQGSQFGSDEFACWRKDNRFSPSMSWHDNGMDNAVAESFISSLKSELLRNGFILLGHKQLSRLSQTAFEQRQIAL
jgi:putative transposase